MNQHATIQIRDNINDTYDHQHIGWATQNTGQYVTSLNVHGVKSIKRRTKSITNDRGEVCKFVDITLINADGTTTTITAWLED